MAPLVPHGPIWTASIDAHMCIHVSTQTHTFPQHQHHANWMADDLQAINRNGKLNIKSPVYFLCEIEMFFASTCKCGHATVPYLCVVCIVCSEDGIEAVRKEDVIRCWNFISSFAR